MKLRSGSSSRVLVLLLAILVLLNLAFLVWNVRGQLSKFGIQLPQLAEAKAFTSIPENIPPATPSPSPSPEAPTSTAVPIMVSEPKSHLDRLKAEGVMLLSVRDGNFIHIFAFHPLYLPLTRISDQPWDDIAPAVSPDGTRLAYSSHKGGNWDLYILDLLSGKEEQVTNTPEYESSPTWSPDSLWIAYERYANENLDIFLLSLSNLQSEPIQLTDDPGVDCSPAWSPQGREIAFLSTRSDDEEIWLAQLDKIDDRFINISHDPQSRDHFPVWSFDGSKLAWASERDGSRQIVLWDPGQPDQFPSMVGEGDRAIWSPDGSVLFSEVNEPQRTGLAAYATSTGGLSMPLTYLPGKLYGSTWIKGPLEGWLADKVQNTDRTAIEPLWKPFLTRTVIPPGRQGLVELENVIAPVPMMHDAVDEAFNALRQQVSFETGWDALHNLENAYVPLTTPLFPSIQNDWLYTGRAFAINPLLSSAGWMVISRENFFGQVYWRVFLKTRYQDGSMGLPLSTMIWDINARYMGDPRAYENGGKLAPAPTGYWVDLVELASRYGWARLPSWTNWRTFYPSIRYNQFLMSGGLDWHQAMAELYPPEALHTPTSVPTVTLTATATPRPTLTPTQPTPTPSSTPTQTTTPTPDTR